LLLIISVRQDNIHANALCDTKHRKYIDWSYKDTYIFRYDLKIIVTTSVSTNVK